MMMIAIEIKEPGGPDVLVASKRPVPEPGEGEVRIRVAAAGLNRPDAMQRQGKYPPPPGASDIPGLEVSGVVVERGARVTGLAPGDRVCALVAGGGYAEYCVVPHQQCLPVPAGVRTIDAAAIPETFFTVWTNLFERAALRAGERVLIHGGTSGIGSTAIQLTKAFGATAYATAGTDPKCDACRQLGATIAINYRMEDFVPVVKQAGGVDVVVDIIGGDYLQRNLDCLGMHGRLVQIGLIGGARASLNLSAILQKRLTITGSTLRARTPGEKGTIAQGLLEHVWPLVAAGQVRPIVDRQLPLDQAAEAHRLLEAGDVIGKIVLITS
jgi:putative PIG3 family NAD(P)H quinone oxidoreductase